MKPLIPYPKRWYFNEMRYYHRKYVDAGTQIDVLQQENQMLREALEAATEPDERPLWKRIANQRRALKAANYQIDLWWRMEELRHKREQGSGKSLVN